jgi:hypothetical protein
VGFLVAKAGLGQVFSEYFGFPCQSSFHQLLHNHPHLSSGAGTIGQKWPLYKGLNPTPLAIIKKIIVLREGKALGSEEYDIGNVMSRGNKVSKLDLPK